MPFSVNDFDEDFVVLLGKVKPNRILDIGAGAGKYAALTRVASDRYAITPHVTALEIDDDYARRFDLISKYDTLMIGGASDLMKNPSSRYDIVVLGDVIEHLRKSEATDLLEFLYYRSSYIFITTPADFEQDAVEGHDSEAHISFWAERDFAGFASLHKVSDHPERQGWSMHMFLLEGLQAKRLPPECRLDLICRHNKPPTLHRSQGIFSKILFRR